MTDSAASFDPGSMSAASLSTQKSVFYRRPWFIITAGIVIVVALSIVADLPAHVSVAEDAASQTSSMHTINADLAPCAFAVKESFLILTQKIDGTLTPSAASLAPTLLKNDQTACSFTSGPIVDLGNNIDVQGTAAGRHISRVLTDSIIWATAYGVPAITDITTLMATPNNTAARLDLTKQENSMDAERLTIDRELYQAELVLNGAPLPNVNIPTLPRIPGT